MSRGKGEGSLYQVGKKTRAQIVMPDGSRPSYLSKTTGAAGKAEARRWLADKQAEKERLGAGALYTSETVFKEYLNNWLVMKSKKLAESTFVGYQDLANRYIIPEFGGLKFHEIGAPRIQRFYDNLLQHEVGARTIQLVHSVLHGCLEQATKTNIIKNNPAKNVVVPNTTPKELVVWTDSQINQFLVAIQGHPHANLYYFLLRTGCRKGEALALKWEDVHLSEGFIEIKRSVWRPPGGGYKFKDTKAHNKRLILIKTPTIDRMRNQWEYVEMLKAGAKPRWKTVWSENDLVFPSMVGTPLDGWVLNEEFDDLQTLAGVPRTNIHGLRHIAATWMIARGIDVITVSKMLGHRTPSITQDIYGHLTFYGQDRAADVLDEITEIIPVE